MRNKIAIIGLIIIVGVTCISCKKQVRNYSLDSKGVYKAQIIIQDSENLSKMMPKKLFFKKIDDINDLTKGKIISSDLFDEDSIAINYEPGVYSVIAAVVQDGEFISIVCFNDEAIKFMAREVKVGSVESIGKIYIDRSNASLLGDIDKTQDFHRKVLSQEFVGLMYKFRLGRLDTSLYKKIVEPKNKKEEEKIQNTVIEEFK